MRVMGLLFTIPQVIAALLRDWANVTTTANSGNRLTMAIATTAVIGLGSMGYGMVRSLLRAGHRVHGFDVAADREAAFRAEGGAEGPVGEIAGTLDAVVIVVLNAAQTEAVLFGADGVVPRLRPGAVVLASATVPPAFARAMEARCAEHSVLYLDAMATTVFELGNGAGPGSAMKAVNQMLAGVHIAMMGEALSFGMTQGITPAQFLEVISQCAGSSWMLENRAPHVVAGDYTPLSQIAIWPKDLGIVLDTAKAAGFSVPITAAAMQQYMVAMGMGLAREDDAAITKVYARNVGLALPGEGS